MQRILALANQKGGVSKTTTAFNLAAALIARGRRVLMIDLDPQASLTIMCGFDQAEGTSLAEVLTGTATIADVTRDLGKGLHVIPSDLALAATELWLVPRMARETILKRALSKIEPDRYDYILIDCPPSLGLLAVNGLTAAQEVIAVFTPEFLSARALALLNQSLDLTRENLNSDLKLLGCLATQTGRTREHAEMLEAIGQRWPVIPVTIPRSIRVAEAARAHQSILDYDSSNPAAEAYRDLAAWVEKQGSKHHGKA
jgi:chromosome partitioning protein